MKKIVLAVTGASGSIYFKRLIKCLSDEHKKNPFGEIGVVFSENAKTVWEVELNEPLVLSPPFKEYGRKDYLVPFASGSSSFDTLILCPCSMSALSKIANGISDCLITRTADVMLKERRKLICVLRETPYNLVHIENMKKVTEAGGIILPATPSFYHKPKTIEDVVDSVVYRIIRISGIGDEKKKWKEK